MGGPALKAGEIEGLRELISQVILEEKDKLVPVTLLQDVEEVRRSPAGAVIRMEGKIDHLDERLASLQTRFDALVERVTTKDDTVYLTNRLDTIEERMATRETMEARFAGVDKRLDTYDFWLKLFGGVLTALMIAQLIAAFVR